MRFREVAVKAPRGGMPAAAARRLPRSLRLWALDISEVGAPQGIAPIHWRLITTHALTTRAMALKMVAFYRLRWGVEEYFHTVKSGGFDIETAAIGDPAAMAVLVAAAAVAALTVMQLLKARDNPKGQAIGALFDAQECNIVAAVNADYQGPNPTLRQKNPHPKTSLAYATWVIGRLGGWTGYYDKPGPKTLSRGLQAFHKIKHGGRCKKADPLAYRLLPPFFGSGGCVAWAPALVFSANSLFFPRLSRFQAHVSRALASTGSFFRFMALAIR